MEEERIKVGSLTKRQLEAEIKQQLRKDFEDSDQTQGYSVNYEIESWDLNEWND